ncbi:type 4a pilus biogenesis protein PilO [uncultured Desulfobacter sp.]|uniref:type 4a pilus biogenesis protein PilO n=1 Tax=uncultured Desulfobacter sp. TaxID=240139 RepID=UPI0029F4D87F|nr:type 4a pilus biogenesis protein PilO [uncultured Desulfobacter sp.]
MKLLPRHIDLMAGLSILVIIVLGGTFCFRIIMENRQKQFIAQQLINKQQTELNLAQNNLAAVKNVLADQQTALNLLNKRIPESADIGLLLSTIHSLVRDRNVTITGFSHEKPVKIRQYYQIQLKLTLQGKFLDIYYIIHKLEALNRLFIIETLNMNHHETQLDGCEALINARIFYNK